MKKVYLKKSALYQIRFYVYACNFVSMHMSTESRKVTAIALSLFLQLLANVWQI